MTSSTQNRRFPAPWTTVRASAECYQVQDANGVTLAWIFCRDDEARYSFGASKLTSDEARRLARGIARLPEFMAQRRGFFPRGGGKRWNPKPERNPGRWLKPPLLRNPPETPRLTLPPT